MTRHGENKHELLKVLPRFLVVFVLPLALSLARRGLKESEKRKMQKISSMFRGTFMKAIRVFLGSRNASCSPALGNLARPS
jgi:hypothetical protein